MATPENTVLYGNDLWLDERIRISVNESTDKNNRYVNRVFAWLMAIQYLVGIGFALWITPLTWVADTAYLHHHVWIAVFFGGILSGLPIYFAIAFPRSSATPYTMAIAQAIWSALLIHLTGGRLETHFHVFASLAFIAFYRDWKVLATMTFVVAADHALRGIFWPMSVYGVVTENPWRWVEHTGWIVMEDIVLVLSCVRGKREELGMCQRQAELELLNTEFEQKVASRTLEIEKEKRNAERLALVVKHTDTSVLVLDSEGRTEWVNDAFTRTTGYEFADLEGKRPYEVLAGPETEQAGIDMMLAGIASGKGFDLEITKQRKDGSRMVMEIEARPIFDAKNNHVVQFVQIERDVTQRKENEAERMRLSQELQESAQHLSKLALVAQHTSNSVIITDAAGKTEWANEGFIRATGFQLNEIVGKKPGEVLHGPDTSQDTLTEIRACLANEASFVGEIINYRKNAEPFWAYLQINPARDENGVVNRYIGVVTDISDRKAAEADRESLHAKLNDAARLAGRADIATGVLHNVGNVLNSVNVSATIIKEQLEHSNVSVLKRGVGVLSENQNNLADFLVNDKRGKAFPEFLRQITDSLAEERELELDEVESLICNIDHIRNIVAAQQSSAKRQRFVDTFDVETLIDSAIHVVGSSLSRHEIKIVKELHDVPAITSEQHELMQVLINLIKNAKEACQGLDSRIVTIRAVEDCGFVKIEVADTGVGIAKENLKNLFQHGFTTKQDGHGFGLHSAAITATELGGSLTANSEGYLKGAVFTLRVPITQDSSKQTTESRAKEVVK